MTTTKQYSIATAAALGINAAATALKLVVFSTCNVSLIGVFFGVSCVSSALSVLGSQGLTNSGTDKSITDYAVNVGTSVMSSGLVNFSWFYNLPNFHDGLHKLCKSEELTKNEKLGLQKIFPVVTAIDAIGAFLTNVAFDLLTKNDQVIEEDELAAEDVFTIYSDIVEF